MGVTGANAEVYTLTLPESVEADTEQPVEYGQLGRAFRASFSELPLDEQLEDDIGDTRYP